MNISQINEPASRQKILASIEPQEAKLHHELLKYIFLLELAERKSQKIFQYREDYTENLYWCGFLLYHVGDLNDVPMMWQAKRLDFDTGCGFDIQILVGGGVEKTIAYLVANEQQEIANYLKLCQEQDDFAALEEWQKFRYVYYYSRSIDVSQYE